MKLVCQYMVIFLNLSSTSNHLHPLQVENCDRIIKNTFGFEKYLTELPVNNRILMTKFWCRNHRLPIEAGCRAQTQRDLRLCLHCNDIGDEYHYLLCCPLFREEREKYINVKF